MLLSLSNADHANVSDNTIRPTIDYIFWSRKFALQYAHMHCCYRSERRYMRLLVSTITITQLVSVSTAFKQWRYCCYCRLQEI